MFRSRKVALGCQFPHKLDDSATGMRLRPAGRAKRLGPGLMSWPMIIGLQDRREEAVHVHRSSVHRSSARQIKCPQIKCRQSCAVGPRRNEVATVTLKPSGGQQRL